MRLEADSLSNVEPAESASNPALAAPQSEISKKRPITLEEIDKQFEFLFNKNDNKKIVRQSVEDSSDEISLAAITPDNRNFIRIIVGGRQCRVLVDPGGTLSLVGPEVAHQFKDRMRETSTRVRTATGNVTRALGNLPLKVEVDGNSKKIVFRAIAELEQELILRMDFCRLFDVDTRVGKGVWRVHDGKWHPFDREDGAGSLKVDMHAECAGLYCHGPSDLERLGLMPIQFPPNIGPLPVNAYAQHGRSRHAYKVGAVETEAL